MYRIYRSALYGPDVVRSMKNEMRLKMPDEFTEMQTDETLYRGGDRASEIGSLSGIVAGSIGLGLGGGVSMIALSGYREETAKAQKYLELASNPGYDTNLCRKLAEEYQKGASKSASIAKVSGIIAGICAVGTIASAVTYCCFK